MRWRLRRPSAGAKLHQLLTSLDPSPFREKELSEDAEADIVGWLDEPAARDRHN